jgi:hypothetical protein
LPTTITVARGGTNLFGASIFAAVVGGAALAWAVDDGGGDGLAATPISSSRRLVMRMVAVSGVASLWWTLAAAVAAVGPGLPPTLGLRTAEATAAAAIAAAVALIAARHGETSVGPLGVIAGVLGTVTVAALAMRWAWIPTFLPTSAHGRWWLVATAGAVIAAMNGRDFRPR